MEETLSPKKKKIHYAWYVCIGCAIVFYVTAGIACNNMPIYYPFIREQYSFSNTMISLLTTSRSIGNILGLSLMPQLYRRLDMKKGLALSFVILAGGMLLLAYSCNFPMFLAANLIVGTVYGLTCMVPLSMLLDRWFVKDKMIAVSIACAGSGVATVGIPSLMTAVLKSSGIRTTAYMETLIVVILGIAAVILVSNRPGDRGISAYGAEDSEIPEDLPKQVGTPGKVEKKPVKAVASSGLMKGSFARYFPAYLVAICCAVASGISYGNISLLAISCGHSVETAAVAVSVAGLFLTVGKLAIGGISEKLGVYKPSVVCALCWGVGLILLCISGMGRAFLFAGAALLATGVAMYMVCMVLWPNDWAEGFDADILKQRMQVIFSTASLAFSVVPGIAADLAGGSYVPIYVFAVFVVMILTVMLVINYRRAGRKK